MLERTVHSYNKYLDQKKIKIENEGVFFFIFVFPFIAYYFLLFFFFCIWQGNAPKL